MDVFEYIFLTTARLKTPCRVKLQIDTGKGTVKFVHGHTDTAPCRVVDVCVLPFEPAQHYEMVKIPVNYAGEYAVFPELFRLTAVTAAFQPVIPGGFYHIDCVGAVTGNTTVNTDLLQRDPLVIISQYHGKRGCPALQRLHLQDNRHPDVSFGNGADFSFHKSFTPDLQLKSSSSS